MIYIFIVHVCKIPYTNKQKISVYTHCCKILSTSETFSLYVMNAVKNLNHLFVIDFLNYFNL